MNNTITRIDLQDFPNEPGVRVSKYAQGWTIKSHPADISNQREMTLDEMVDWLISHDWDVVRWEAGPELGIPAGARAFRPGTRKSVRSKGQLKKMRDSMKAKAEAYFRTPESFRNPPSLINRIHVIDLAYEL